VQSLLGLEPAGSSKTIHHRHSHPCHCVENEVDLLRPSTFEGARSADGVIPLARALSCLSSGVHEYNVRPLVCYLIINARHCWQCLVIPFLSIPFYLSVYSSRNARHVFLTYYLPISNCLFGLCRCILAYVPNYHHILRPLLITLSGMNCGIVQTGRLDPVISFGSVSSHVHKIAGGSSK